jgi:sulfate adenylyltransferase subunit 1 (EFTu-like GTPase family)
LRRQQFHEIVVVTAQPGIPAKGDARRVALEQVAAGEIGMNDIARVSSKLAQPLVVDRYAENRATGAFIVIDESTNNTVGAGMIL